MKNKKVQRKFRHQRVRKKITGTSKRPRLAVFRSNKHIYAQLIDDATFRTITSSSDSNLSSSEKSLGKMDRIKTAFEVGLNLAKSATKKKVKKVDGEQTNLF